MKKLLFILLLYYPINAYTQEWSFEYSLGYGTYQLDDIKSLQKSILNNLDDYGLENTDCFPNYITHSFAFGIVSKHHYFGSNFSYLSTGGRLHRADYSGSYTVDMIMNGYRLGVFHRYYVNTKIPTLYTYLQLSTGVLFSSLKIKEQVNIYSESLLETNKLKGVGIYFEPTFGATYRFTNWLHFSLAGGYAADFLGTLKLSGQKTKNKANWNGFRIYGGFLFILPTQKKVTQ